MDVNLKLKKKLNICRRLKQARKNAGYKSARAFMEKNKLSRTYHYHENGRYEIPVISIVNYCRLLNVSYLWLIAGYEKHKNKPFSDAEIEKLE